MNAQLGLDDPRSAQSVKIAPALCFHCNEPIPAGIRIFAQLKQQQEAMCCEGCRAVAELIASAGLQDYYQYRSEPAVKPDETDEWQLYSQPQIATQYVRDEERLPGQCSAVILADGIRCAACSWLIDRMLRRDGNIKDVNVNLATSRVHVTWQGEPNYFAEILRALSRLGYRPHALDAQGLEQHTNDERRSILKRLGVSGVGMMQVMMYVLPMYVHSDMDAPVRHYLQLVGLLLTTPVLFYAGWPFIANAVRALRIRVVNMDVPVAIALVLAYGASVFNTLMQRGETYFDSVTMFIFLLTLARFVVMTVRHRSQSVADALVRIQPRIAHCMKGNTVVDVAVNQLAAGDIVLVRVGEAVPADGIIVVGQTSLNEQLLTGESLPVARRAHDKVMAGSINLDAPLHVQVTELGQRTVLSGILSLLEQVQRDKPPAVLLADNVSQRFLQAMLITTLVVAISWWFIDSSRVFNTVLAVLVVTCPCALSLATPAVIAATTTAMARRGLLITHANTIEQLAQVDTVAFDKTGTLTTGEIAITKVAVYGELDAEQCRAIAAALEVAVVHPIAKAFSSVNASVVTASELRVVAGAGVEGLIGGTRYRLGSPTFVCEFMTQPSLQDDASTIWLGNHQTVLACFEVDDTLRPEAISSVHQLRQLACRTVLISGDAMTAVNKIAMDCGFVEFFARQSPADKVRVLHQYQSKSTVAMVGDGINDAPVLGAASVSIAMGVGASLAQASADAVLMNNSLLVVPQAILLARRAQRIMRQNLYWAAIYNLSAVPLAAMGYISPWLAAAGMSLSSILVVLNAARVLKRGPLL